MKTFFSCPFRGASLRHALILPILLLGSGLDVVAASSDLASQPTKSGPLFIEVDPGFVAVNQSSVAWGDYDNDGDLDVLLTGRSDTDYVARVYRNDGGANFTDIGASLVGVAFSSVAWGDYDNDGDLDILLTGIDSAGSKVGKVYRNDGGSTFVDFDASIPGVYFSAVAWGDYDSDGDLDILLSGVDDDLDSITRIYRNWAGGGFGETLPHFPAVKKSSVAWGDADNDGDLDLLVTGELLDGSKSSVVYENDGSGTFTDLALPLTGVGQSSAAWGDYDNDGDLDILLAGADENSDPVTRLYRNDGEFNFSEVNVGLTGVSRTSLAWGDYDNDGDLDILLTGRDAALNGVAKLYRNDGGGSFLEIETGLPGVTLSSAAWGDYDNDGDLDILLTGSDGVNRVSKLYENQTVFPNTRPTPPENLTASWSYGRVTFSWDPASDAQTPSSGLNYNLRVGFTPGGNEIMAPMTEGGTGFRLIPASGNTSHTLTWTLQVPLSRIYWSVQAVDPAFAGSEFAPERSDAPPFVEVLQTNGCRPTSWADVDNDGDLDLITSGTIHVNEGDGIFTPTDTGLPGGRSAWGDYDGDGDLDLVRSSRLFRNDGTSGGEIVFTDIRAIPGAGRAVAWGDYDNDGDLDLLVAGSGEDRHTTLYRNDREDVFTSTGIPFIGVGFGSVAWGDYDNDGDLDFVVTGFIGTRTIMFLARNDGSGSFDSVFPELPGVAQSSIAWGDYDNDGDLDLLFSGWEVPSNEFVAVVARNEGDGTFTDIEALLTGVRAANVHWGDYDNDGDLDILISGIDLGGNDIATVYRSDGDDSFTAVEVPFPEGCSYSAWGDFDNDGDLDIHAARTVYENATSNLNTPPAAPISLTAEWLLPDQTELAISWGASADAQTPEAGLSYNLRVGTVSGGDDVQASHADAATGYRRVPELGNSGQSLTTSLRLGPLPPTLYYSVQAVDGAFSGSEFAEEKVIAAPNPSFIEIDSGFADVDQSSLTWGDYDNDGDLDVLLTGRVPGVGGVAGLYRNDGKGTFVDVEAPLTGVFHSSVAWGDFNNDGNLDIILTGESATGPVARVYRNDGVGNFLDIDAPLPGVSSSSVAWGDYDQDGDLDILLTGLDAAGDAIADIHENDGQGAFAPVSAGLAGVSQSAVAWNDYDNDGDLDILLTGEGSTGAVTQLYQNNGDGSFTPVDAALPALSHSAIAWGDYDSDGDSDILIAGQDDQAIRMSRIYRNDGGGSFTDIGADLIGISEGAVGWGDYNNDGELDVLLTGRDGEGGSLARVYRQSQSMFSPIFAGLAGVGSSSAQWGDYDSDGDLDILLSGETDEAVAVANLYANVPPNPNTAPGPPDDLVASWAPTGEQQVTFSWSPGTDAETPTPGLNYNLRIGTTPDGQEITATMSDNVDGYRRIPTLGNAGQALSVTLELESVPLYWSVQTVDGSFAGSEFSPEDVVTPSFLEFAEVEVPFPDVFLASVAWGDYDQDGDPDVLLTGFSSREEEGWVARIYRNDGAGAFADIGAPLTGVSRSSVAWGDYDNDGDLDILLTGDGAVRRVAKLYRNDGGDSFYDIGAPLTGVGRSFAAWGDYNNDGKLDILLTGSNSGNKYITHLYRNDGGDAFTKVKTDLPGVSNSSVAWGDYDNDGDMDIVLSGTLFGGDPIVKVYRNDGNEEFVDIDAAFIPTAFCSVAWGDFDNDGDLDILANDEVYRNDGGDIFETVSAEISPVVLSSSAWGDFDNDGDLDIVVTGGKELFIERRLEVYRNEGAGTFSSTQDGLPGASSSSVAWGDYESDGDLDILVAGLGPEGHAITKLFVNRSTVTNTPPIAPTNLEATWSDEANVVFRWDPASDAETPVAGLSYNLRVGTTPGGQEVSAAMSDPFTGDRYIPALGNTSGSQTWSIHTTASPLYWAVQSVDTGFVGSLFSAEETTSSPPSSTPDVDFLPTHLSFRTGQPNPFLLRTDFRFELPSATNVRLVIYDAAGRKVRTLVDTHHFPGRFDASWRGDTDQGGQVAPGVYFVRFEAGGFQRSAQLIRIR